MIDTASTLRSLISDFMSGRIPAELFDAEVARLSEGLPAIRDEALSDLVGKLDLLMAEQSSGHLDRDDMLSALRELAPLTIDLRQVVEEWTVRVTATATVDAFRSRLMVGPAAGQPLAVGRPPAVVLG